MKYSLFPFAYDNTAQKHEPLRAQGVEEVWPVSTEGQRILTVGLLGSSVTSQSDHVTETFV